MSLPNRYAVIDEASGRVENLILWDGASPWAPPEGRSAMLASEADIGDRWDGARFLRPPPPAPEPVSRELLVREAVMLQAKIDAATRLASSVPGTGAEAERLARELDAVKARIEAAPG